MNRTQHDRDRRPEYTVRQGSARGLNVFAAVMLLLAGLLDVFRGIMGIAGDDVFARTSDYVFRFDLTGWSWIHLALGVLAVLVAVGLFRAERWARFAAVVPRRDRPRGLRRLGAVRCAPREAPGGR
jgi:hypothetical protein